MTDASLAHLLGRLAAIEERVAEAVAARRADDPNPDDAFRGLYLSEAGVDRILESHGPTVLSSGTAMRAEVEKRADAADAEDASIRLRTFAQAFVLDAGRHRPAARRARAGSRRPVRAALRLSPGRRDTAAREHRTRARARRPSSRRCRARGRFSRPRPARGGGLVLVEEPERPFLDPRRSASRTASHNIFSVRTTSTRRSRPSRRAGAVPDVGDSRRSAARWLGSTPLLSARAPGRRRTSLAAAAFAERGGRRWHSTWNGSQATEDAAATTLAAVREARLRGAGLVVGPVERLLDLGVASVRALADVEWPTVLTGSRSLGPGLVAARAAPRRRARRRRHRSAQRMWATSLTATPPRARSGSS